MSYTPPTQSPAFASTSRPATFSPYTAPSQSTQVYPDEPNQSTPLKSITSASGFVFPPIWSFPPFFTLQLNPSTLSHQLGLWTTLILNWAKHHRIWEINVDAIDPPEVFRNRSIDRRLLPPAVKDLLLHMAKEGESPCQVAAEPPKQATRYLLYWRKPEEWGTMIYDWVTENGLTGSIMTFYEITDGDLSYTTDFREMPAALLRKSLETLVKRGKAQILKGEGEAGEGVRFL